MDIEILKFLEQVLKDKNCDGMEIFFTNGESIIKLFDENDNEVLFIEKTDDPVMETFKESYIESGNTDTSYYSFDAVFKVKGYNK